MQPVVLGGQLMRLGYRQEMHSIFFIIVFRGEVILKTLFLPILKECIALDGVIIQKLVCHNHSVKKLNHSRVFSNPCELIADAKSC